MPENNTQLAPTATAIVKKLRPLAPVTKKSIVDQLSKFSDEQLQSAMVAAINQGQRFPKALRSKVDPFIALVLAQKDNPTLLGSLQPAIKLCLSDGFLKEFRILLESKFDESDWSSSFLRSFAKTLTIKTYQPAVTVQVAIQSGKIYWRLMVGTKEVFNKFNDRQPPIDFDKLDHWFMPWQQFKLFKNSGKRSGNIAVTLERFKAVFDEAYHPDIEQIWHELKNVGILNEKNRLSHAWYASSNIKILLPTIERIKNNPGFTRENIRERLKSLKALKRKVTKAMFLNKWSIALRPLAGKVWDKLIENGIIDDKGNIDKLTTLRTDFLNDDLFLSYEKIATALFDICRNSAYQESVPEFPKMSTIRYERTLKSWNKSGLLENYEPKSETNCVKAWDVDIFKELQAHRCTEDERENHADNKLNYDHIPSADALRKIAIELSTQNQADIDRLVGQQKTLKENRDKRLETLRKTRDLVDLTPDLRKELTEEDAELKGLETELDKTLRELQTAELRKRDFAAEMDNHGPFWWTIAILEKLHKQGSTFLVCSSDQAKIQGNSLFNDLKEYISILQTRPQEFLTKPDEFLTALGAFRYLYKRNLANPINLKDHFSIGRAPHSFFNNPADKQAIDSLLSNSVQTYIERREKELILPLTIGSPTH